MPKFLKKLSIRYVKWIILNFFSKNPNLANKFSIYNIAKSFEEIDGRDLILMKDSEGFIFVAKKFKNILVAENTGCNLYKNGSLFNVIAPTSGTVPRNWVKISTGPKKICKIEGSVINLIGVHKGVKHYFHIFFDYIFPLLFFLKKYQNSQESISILVRNNPNHVQRELYNLIEENFPYVKFILVEKGAFFECENLIYFNHFHNAFYDYQRNSQISETIFGLRDLLLKKYQIPNLDYTAKDLIYISRNRARLRKNLNEKSFQKELHKRGFKTVVLEDISFKEQVATFFNAKFIIATHGAGYTNLIFSNQKLHFLEIFSKKYGSKDYHRISKILNLKRYEYRENNEFMWQAFYLNIKKILPQIDKILHELEKF